MEIPMVPVPSDEDDSQPVFRSTFLPRPFGIALDEFGRDLYEAIRLNSARIQCERNIVVYTQKGLTQKAAEECTKAKGFHAELHKVLDRNTIAPADVRRLVEMR